MIDILNTTTGRPRVGTVDGDPRRRSRRALAFHVFTFLLDFALLLG